MKAERFFFLLVLILVAAMAARTPVDSDLWWHLRAGEATWELARPLTMDLFSHTRFGEPWVNHSWLAQVGLFWAYRWGGSLGLAVLVAGLATLSMALVYQQMEGHPLLRAFVIILASAVTGPVWSPRPQLFSLALFAALGYLLYLYKRRRCDRLWLVVPLFTLWSNLHGGYILGLILIAALAAGECLNHLLGKKGETVIPWSGVARLLGWGGMAALAVAINPNGTAMWAIPFKTVGVETLQAQISEWASPDFHQLAQQPYLWLLLATFGAAGLSARRLDGGDLATLAAFAALALLARRNFGPFALVAAPVLARHLADLRLEGLAGLENWARPALQRRKLRWGSLSPRWRTLLNVVILLLLGSVALLKLLAVSSAELVAEAEKSVYPLGAVTWIKDHSPPGAIFNEYNWGGYLTWNLREYPVFVDGRTDLFDDELLVNYLQAEAGVAGWQGALDRYGINMVLIPAGAGLAGALDGAPAWSVAYRDEQAAVYLRKVKISVNRGGAMDE
ncbi:MAG TPA: hypothetical protein VJ436_12760 [Anaerolineales bacterium]|nr:hypothetical protein [Anaerolineales bacterium]